MKEKDNPCKNNEMKTRIIETLQMIAEITRLNYGMIIGVFTDF